MTKVGMNNVSLVPLHLIPAAAQAPLSWTVAWLGITHIMYAAVDINAGHIMMQMGKPFYFYHRYAELVLHFIIGARFLRPDHALLALWHLWKYIDVTAGGRVTRYPRVAHALDWLDAAAWLWSGWTVNMGVEIQVFASAAIIYAILLYIFGGPDVRGNDAQGSIAYSVSLVRNTAKTE